MDKEYDTENQNNSQNPNFSTTFENPTTDNLVDLPKIEPNTLEREQEYIVNPLESVQENHEQMSGFFGINEGQNEGQNNIVNNNSVYNNMNNFNQSINPVNETTQPAVNSQISNLEENTFGNGDNNSNISSLPKNNKKIIYVVCLVIILIIGIVICSLFMNKKQDGQSGNEAGVVDSDNSSTNSNNDNSTNEKIKKIYIYPIVKDEETIIALTESGKLYAIGYSYEGRFGQGSDAPKNLDKLTLIASDAKDFDAGVWGTTYVTNSNELKFYGLNFLKGGVVDEWTLAAKNVKKAYKNYSLCSHYVDLNGNLYGLSLGEYDGNYCGIGNTKFNYVQLATSVDDVYVDSQFTFYIKDGKLYVFMDGSSNEKFIMENVKSFSGRLILTNNNELYAYVYSSETKEWVIEKREDNVAEIYENGIYKTNDGKFKFNYSRKSPPIFYNIVVEENDHTARIDIKDMKELYYINKDKGLLIYLDNENIVHIYAYVNGEDETISLEVQNIEKIFALIKEAKNQEVKY